MKLMKNPVLIYNPKCSKSRAALKLISSKFEELDAGKNYASNKVELCEYLSEPISVDFLKYVKSMMPSTETKDLIRWNEKVDSSCFPDVDAESDEELFEKICKTPSILQRPIFIYPLKSRAIIARPPEKALELFED